MLRGITCLTAVVLVVSGLAVGGEPGPPVFACTMMDGTIVTGPIDLAHLAVKTRYGDLTVPLADVAGLTPGLDRHPELAERIGALLAALGSPAAGERERAQKELIAMGPWLEAIVAAHADGLPPDQQAPVRTAVKPVVDAWKKPTARAPAERKLARHDQVQTEKFLIAGRIQESRLRIFHPCGKFDMDVSRIRHLTRVEHVSRVEALDCDHIAARLLDGTLVKGTTDLVSLALDTPYGKLDIPLPHVETIEPGRAAVPAVVRLRGGDVLRGTTDLKTLTLQSGDDKLDVPLAKAARIDVFAGKLHEGLAYHWSFNDGNAVDSVRGVAGQVVGKVVFEKGILGQAALITNHSTKIVVQSPDFNMNGWPQVTLSVWGKMKKYSTYGQTISRAHGTQGCGVNLRVGGNYGYWTGGGFSVGLERERGLGVRSVAFGKRVKPFPKTGVWYHLVGTYDGRRVRFYINGKLDVEAIAPTPGLRVRDLPEARMVIGRAASTRYDRWRDTYFPGLLDEVRIWKRALTAAEVAYLYRRTLRRSESSGSL